MAETDPAWLLGFLKLPCSSALAMVPEEKPMAEPANGSWWYACVARIDEERS